MEENFNVKLNKTQQQKQKRKQNKKKQTCAWVWWVNRNNYGDTQVIETAMNTHAMLYL